MKKLTILALIIIISIATGCKQGNRGLSTDIIQNGKVPIMTFDNTFHDFGSVTQGEILSYTYNFTNTGNGDLLIVDVHPQCSCTGPEWPKDIIKPGDKGEIKVKFDSNGKHGLTTKIVTIEANTNPKNTPLKFTADIHDAPKK